MPGPLLRALLVALLLFSAFFTYYHHSSDLLPQGAGPDYAASNDAVAFLRENRRLATLPADEERLKYTVYGSTRALRPPLSYVVGAVMAELFDDGSRHQHITYRKGSVLLCALSVALVFATLVVLFGNTMMALAGALLVGLMPQFAFIASYNNDDSGAIFSASLLVFVLALIFRYGISTGFSALLGIAAGLLIFSKPTAWLLAPGALLCLLLFVRGDRTRLLRDGMLAVVLAIAAGGWWIGFNMNHYGWDDPFARKVQAIYGEKHRRVEANVAKSYLDRGIGLGDIVLRNADNFWLRSFKSTVGKLDWLRLDVGRFQYGLYFGVFAIGISYWLLRLAGFLVSAVRGRLRTRSIEDWRWFALETAMFLIISVQLFVYVWRNVHTDIQLQGKYLLPVISPMMILFSAAIYRLLTRFTTYMATAGRRELVMPVSAVGPLAFALLAGVAIIAHVDALRSYVIPFYLPPARDFKITWTKPIPLVAKSVVAMNDVDHIDYGDEGMILVSSGRDPWLVLAPELCRKARGSVLLRIVVRASHHDIFKVYVNRKEGFHETDTYSASYHPGKNELTFGMGLNKCRGLRLDFATVPATITIKKITLQNLRISTPR